jgi:hypothetical protein
MIEQLIGLFDAAVTAPVATKHGLAILGPDGPMKRTQAGQYTPIAVDNEAPWSYWRIGDIRSTPYDIYACSMGALQQVPLRLVMLLPNDCGQRDILLAAGRSVSATTGAAKELLGTSRVRVVGQRIAVDGVARTENISDIPLQWSLIAIDMDLEVIGTADCLVGCEEGPSVLCAVIGTASNAEVVECLGDRLNEICDGSGPCDPATVQLLDGDGGAIGVPVEAACGEATNITAPNASVEMKNSAGDHLASRSVVSGGSEVIVAPDATINPKNSAGDALSGGGDIPSGWTLTYTAPDGTAQLYDDDSPTPNPIGSPVPIPAGTTVPVTAPHGTVYTTDGVTPVMEVLSGGVATLPKIDIPSIGSGGMPATQGPFDTKFGSGNLFPLVSIPRRELKDSSGSGIGIYAALDVLIADTIPDIPDSAITLPNAVVVNVKATQPYTVPQTAALKFAFGQYDQGSDLWTVTTDEAGNYNAYTQDGGSGTITYSKNGGAFVALSGTITLAVGDTIQVKRTTITAAGWSRWQRQVTP